VNGQPTSGGLVRWEDFPGQHAACDAEIARLRSLCAAADEHLPAIRDALRMAVAEAPYSAPGARFRAALQALGDDEQPVPATPDPLTRSAR
jgi:hypothetical protein